MKMETLEKAKSIAESIENVKYLRNIFSDGFSDVEAMRSKRDAYTILRLYRVDDLTRKDLQETMLEFLATRQAELEIELDEL